MEVDLKIFDVPSFLELDSAYQIDDVVYRCSLLEILGCRSLHEDDYYKIIDSMKGMSLSCKEGSYLMAASAAAGAGGHSLLAEVFQEVADCVKNGKEFGTYHWGYEKQDIEKIFNDVKRKAQYPKPDYKHLRSLVRSDIDITDLLSLYYEVDEDELELLLELADTKKSSTDQLLQWIEEYNDLPEALFQSIGYGDLGHFLTRHAGQLESMINELHECTIQADGKRFTAVIRTFLRHEYLFDERSYDSAHWYYYLFIKAYNLRDKKALLKYGRFMTSASKYFDRYSGYWDTEYHMMAEYIEKLLQITDDKDLLFEAVLLGKSVRHAVMEGKLDHETLLRGALKNLSVQNSEKLKRRRF